jgi:carbon starvation protein CstA
MAWSNQTLATIVLWAITIYLKKEGKFYWITLIPSIFMTAVIFTYILIAPEGFKLSQSIAYPLGFALTGVFTIFFTVKYKLIRL